MFLPLPERFTEHRRLVAAVEAAGCPAPKRWRTLSEHLDAFLAMTDTAATQLAQAVANPAKTTDLPLLRALALAEAQAGPPAHAHLNAVVVAHVHADMREAYTAAADDTYRQIAARFDAAAQEFTAAATACNVAAEPADMVAADDTTRTAWLNAAVIAAQLDGLVPAVRAAAELAGLDLTNHPNPDTTVLPLICDPGATHRRRVWEAFHATGRTGRWGALTAIGVTLRACPLDSFAPYREPAPVKHVQRQRAGQPRGMVENVVLDPEDAPATALPVEQRPSRLTAV